MANLQSSFNRILGTALVARQLQMRDPRTKQAEELKSAEEGAARSERTISAYENFIKGKNLPAEQRKLVQKAVEDEQKTHAANTEKLMLADPSPENVERYLSQGTSRYMRDRLRALSRLDDKQKMVTEQRKRLEERRKKMQSMPTSLGGTVGELPADLQKKIIKAMEKEKNNGKK